MMTQFNGLQDNFQFWKGRVRALLIEKEANTAFILTKEQNSAGDKKNATAKA